MYKEAQAAQLPLSQLEPLGLSPSVVHILSTKSGPPPPPPPKKKQK